MSVGIEIDLGREDVEDASRLGIARLEEMQAALRSALWQVEREPAEERDQARLTTLQTELAAVGDRLLRARRGYALRRIGQYVEGGEEIDRAAHLTSIVGDVVRLGVGAQVAADSGDWEDAAEQLKAAKARLGDAASLAKLAAEGHLRHRQGGQLALDLDEG